MANPTSPVAAGRIQLVGGFSPSPTSTSFIPTSVIANKAIGPGPKLVFSRLLAYAAMNQPATNKRLAADLAVSPRRVRNYITALKDAGLVEVQLHPGKARSFRLATNH